MQSIWPGLAVVAMPLGNPDDLSPRAASTLEEAGLILAEDTRRARKLLSILGIKYKKLLSFFEHNEEKKLPYILELLRNGQKIAIISDAGTPVLADPGYQLVKACRQEGIKVTSIPGPSAPITALAASGLPPIPFSFLGFLPRGNNDRENLFSLFSHVPGSLVFFERRDRLRETLEIAFNVLGNRQYTIARELTKTYEEYINGYLAEYDKIPELLGEITIIISPGKETVKTAPDIIKEMANRFQAEGIKAKEIAKLIKAETNGWSTSEIYNFINEQK